MVYYDDKLLKLHENVMRKKQLRAILSELREQKSSLTYEKEELRKIMKAAQDDVDKLEGGSLAAFFYNVVDKNKSKLEKEREEAYAAKVKYDAAVAQYNSVSEQMEHCLDELKALGDCETEYERLYKEKTEMVMASGSATVAEALRTEAQIAFLNSQINELKEAKNAGNKALKTISNIRLKLSNAEDWGMLDMGSGGLVPTLIKHSELDDAQDMVYRLQEELRCFKTELADIRIDAELWVDLDGFSRFADFFFDCLFSDWTVLEQIRDSRERVYNTKLQIEQVLRDLDVIRANIEKEIDGEKDRLARLIISTDTGEEKREVSNRHTIRFANASDVNIILNFINLLAKYEDMSDQVVATEELLSEWIFEKKKAEVLIAEEAGTPVGFALFFHNFSTFLGRAGIYLEDLFVLPEYRGKGYGKALLKKLALITKERGCGRLEWACLDWNRPSIDFYMSLGAAAMDEWTVYRLTGETLDNMAK